MLISVLLISTATPAFASSSQSPHRPPVVRQSLDQSCGLASIATILQWGGLSVTEAELLILLREKLSPELADQLERGEVGLSVTELRSLVAALDLGITLEPRYLTSDQLRRVSAREVVIVFSVEGSDKSETNSGHFTIIDGFSEARGYLRADTLDGSYTFQSEVDLVRSTTIWRENTVLQALFVRRDGRPLVLATPVTEVDEASYGTFARSLLVRAISPLSGSQALVSMSIDRTVFDQDLSALGVPVTITSDIETAVLGFRASVGRGTDLSVSAPLSLETTYVRLQGEPARTETGEDWTFGPVAMAITKSWSAPSRPHVVVAVSLDASVGEAEFLRGYGARLDLALVANDRTTLFAGVDARRELEIESRDWTTSSRLSVGAVRRLSGGWWASVEGGLPLALPESRSERGSLLLALERELENRWVVGGFTVATFSEDRAVLTVGLAARYLFSRNPFNR